MNRLKHIWHSQHCVPEAKSTFSVWVRTMSSLALLIFCFIPNSVLAQTCGSLFTPDTPWYYPDPTEITLEETLITDCSAPFGPVVSVWPDDLRVTVAGVQLEPEIEIVVPEEGTREYEARDVAGFRIYEVGWFLHTPEGLQYVPSTPTEITEDDIEELAAEFFDSGIDTAPYVAAVYEGSYEIDGEYSELLSEFHEYVNANFVSTKPLLSPGTYTVAIFDVTPVLSKQSPWQRFREWFIATAYAALPTTDVIYTRTFTLKTAPVEPVGASSVLFLPGIQASRLYKEGILGTEDQLWEPNTNQDVNQLAMTETGESINEIYTRDVIDEVAFPLFGDNIYKSFLRQLEELHDDGVIASYEAFAYDWRYNVFDSVETGTRYEEEVKDLVAILENLADNSFTGKVTIIGHSNGGLLGKALLTRLAQLNKSELVDKLVLVGVPQLGTPKALGVLLHGLEQQKFAGLVIDDETARAVTKNMPGVYNLLPSPRFFSETDDILVTTSGSNNASTVAAYGDIVTYEQMRSFVLDTDNRRPNEVSINEPATLNSGLFDDMTQSQSILDTWSAPPGVSVYEVVGTGQATIRGFEYRAFPCVTGTCLLEQSKQMKPYPLFTNQGDETVLAISAAAHEGEKVVGYVDLEKEGDGVLNPDFKHAEITESPAVQSFIDSIIRFPYLNDTLEVPQDFVTVETTYTIIGAHSPVQISLVTESGKRVGIFGDELFEEVSGSQYFEIGGSSYLVLPKDNRYTVTVKGLETGVYSLTIDTLTKDNTQITEHLYKGASTSPTMIATFSNNTSGFSNLRTDLDGNGTVDFEQTLDGELVVQPELMYTYQDLRREIQALSLKRIEKLLLLVQVEKAEHLHVRNLPRLELLVLKLLDGTLRRLERRSDITRAEYESLHKIINYLGK